MPRKTIFLLFYYFFVILPVMAQCPDKDLLQQKLMAMKDSLHISTREKLTELLPYETAIKNCPYKNDSTHALLLRRIGGLYFFMADYFHAVGYYRQSINMSTSLGMGNALGGNYYYLSVFYDSLNNVSEKIKALDSCLAIYKRTGLVDKALLTALYTRAQNFYDIGDYHRCIEYAEECEIQAWRYTREQQRDYATGTGYVLSSLTWRVNSLIRLKDYKKAEALLLDKVEECRKTNLEMYLGTIYALLGELQIHKEDYPNALRNLNKAIQYDKQAGRPFGCRQILNTIGHDIYYARLSDYNSALHFYKQSLKYENNDPEKQKDDLVETVNILNNIANIYVRKGKYDSAFRYFRQAFDMIKTGTSIPDILQSSSGELVKAKKIHYLMSLLADEGDAYLVKYKAEGQAKDLREALRIYKAADRLLSKTRTIQYDLKSRLFWRSDNLRLYEHGIEASWLSNNTEDAFYFFEKSRAVLLNDQLIEQQWMGQDDILRQTQMRREILRLEKDMNQVKKDSPEYTVAVDKLFAHNQELDRLINTIKTKNPLYYQSFLDSGLITLQQVKKIILNEYDALVEFFSGDSAVYVLLISKTGMRLRKIEKSVFDRQTSLFVKYISDEGLLNSNYTSFLQTSAALYRLIFSTDTVPSGRIVISPAGQYFPFEALVTRTEPAVYFLEEHAVSYTYSARYLLNNFGAVQGNVKDFMGMAPLRYPNNKRLSALPGSDQSLAKLQSYFISSDSYIGVSASRSKFLQEFSKYRIIQLYTHASDNVADEPVIYFSDSVLYLSEIITAAKPVASLIVLSACETGTGELHQGEGVFSFNRAFAAIGIPSAITNLWSIDNESTYRLTGLFYKYLTKGLSFDIALQKAKLEFIKTGSRQQSLPYYWAPAILVGKTATISPQKSFPWKWTALAMVLASAVVLLLRKIRRSGIGNQESGV